jgi:predicted enzyme related to lactoylglutathione lyase
MGRPVVHFELWTKNQQRLSAFYETVFDWRIREIPELAYRQIETGGGSGIDGGMMTPQEGPWPGNMAFYVDVEDLAATGARIRAAGGTVLVERQEIPGLGAIALFEDPDGRVLGLWQRLRDARAQ